jgi:hypothetical protein
VEILALRGFVCVVELVALREERRAERRKDLAGLTHSWR